MGGSALFLVFVFLPAGLAGGEKPAGKPAARPEYKKVLIEKVPHVRQKPDFCGEACAEMYLRKLGKDADQDFVFEQSGLDPALGRGCWTKELVQALQKIGFKTGNVWNAVRAKDREKRLEKLWAELHGDLLKGIPSILCTRYDEKPGAPEHFRLFLGYDPDSDEAIFHEPAEEGGAYRRMKRSRLFAIWPLGQGEELTAVRIRLEPGAIRAAPLPEGLCAADYAQHIRALRPRVPRGFSLVLERPFVVLGDQPEAEVRLHAARTVQWAVRLLKKDYFEKDPEEIIDIWLFQDEKSYRKHTKEIFLDDPSTPFGYYSEEHRALIMNIATGGGTLVHEIVHPFLRANFPGCPAWFSEGLASLYEQSGERDGHIRGFTNWRLEGLQKAIREKRTVPLERLLGQSDREFYGNGSGLHYAEARYLLHHLQEKGLLVKYYQKFLAAREKDPTGSRTLQEVLGEKDLAEFQKRWEASVLQMKFP